MTTPEVTVLVPGDVDEPTGGNVYDRRISAAMGRQGLRVSVRRVDGDWPRPDERARAALAAELAALPDGAVVLGDGLVIAGVPEIVEPHARRLRLVALVHLPLAGETGLPSEEARRLAGAERRTLAACRAVVVTGPWAADAVRASGVPADRVHVVEPGTDPAAERGEGADLVASGSEGVGTVGGDASARGPTRARGPTLLCLAAITPRKAQHVLVEALAGLTDLPWTCRLVGPEGRDPHYAAKVRAAVGTLGLAGRITVTGAVEGRALDAVWAATDLLVLPSVVETYGMVVAEALSRGVPVLTTSGGGAERTAAGAGLLVPPGDVPALRAALRRWLTDADLRTDLRRRAVVAGGGLPTWDDAARRLRDVLTIVGR